MNLFVEKFAIEIEAVASRMDSANFGRKPQTGYIDLLRIIAADMRKQSAGGSIPDGLHIDAMSAVADGVVASRHAGAPRQKMEPHFERLFAAAGMPAPAVGQVLSWGEVNEVLDRARISDPQRRMAVKLELETAGLLPAEGPRRDVQQSVSSAVPAHA